MDVPLDGIAFSIELLEWSHAFSGFWGKKFLVSRNLRSCHCIPKVTKVRSIIGQRIGCNGIGVQRDHRPKPSKSCP